MLRLKQSSTFLSTYTADVSGVCSALYELGGMVIMHDASGCNSTYSTHDEPRWYQMDSMIYISALTEIDAMLGNDEKLIVDACKAAKDLSPRFIAICGSPIPMLMGTDFTGIARVIEDRTGIPTLGINTDGMHSYLYGIDMALLAFVKKFCRRECEKTVAMKDIICDRVSDTTVQDNFVHDNLVRDNLVQSNIVTGMKPCINLLGVTPLDFSITGNVESMKAIFEQNGYRINSCFAMGSTMEEMSLAGNAEVNVLVSSAGLSTARYLQETFGIPYVIGIPMGVEFTKVLFAAIDRARGSKDNQFPAEDILIDKQEAPVYIIGEPIFASSLRYTLWREFGYGNIMVLSPLETDSQFLTKADSYLPYEKEIRERIMDAAMVIADPLYRRIVKKGSETVFIDFPHEAYSGRIYRDEIPNFIEKDLNKWFEKERMK
ncbi:MAG TPA: nitrogenase component 1 [Mobilitalea sp.]|nr:nitrogenase component 1 [Mobilitalea sp.]